MVFATDTVLVGAGDPVTINGATFSSCLWSPGAATKLESLTPGEANVFTGVVSTERGRHSFGLIEVSMQQYLGMLEFRLDPVAHDAVVRALMDKLVESTWFSCDVSTTNAFAHQAVAGIASQDVQGALAMYRGRCVLDDSAGGLSFTEAGRLSRHNGKWYGMLPDRMGVIVDLDKCQNALPAETASADLLESLRANR